MSLANFPLRPLALACAALIAVPAHAAAQKDETLRLLEKMNARLEQLEKRNAELEQQVKAATQHASPVLEQRVKTLEETQARVNQGLDNDNVSEYEPELTSRLKAVEMDALSVKKAARKIDALDGIKAGMSLTTVAQRPSGLPQGLKDGNSQLNYRTDVTVELPLDPIGDTEQKIFAHVRIGQGQGLNAPMSNLGAFASAPNAVAFRASGASPDDSVAILGQAWYQASIPLPFGGFKPRSREKLELTFGKMDLFGFFDQNVAAGDEGRQFLNSIFVHNPLLDAGAQIGVDANGFQPGFVASYLNEFNKPEPWRLSLGFFGSGKTGSNYQRSLTSPLIMAQAEKTLRFFDGLPGHYRAYFWQRSKAVDFDGVTTTKHAGWGLSIDQRVGDGVTLFSRYGQQTNGAVRFDRALTLGAEISGAYWSRGADAIGIAVGALHASNEFRASPREACLELDANNQCINSFTYNPSGAEKIAELYYRYRITKQFELTPNLQYLTQLGGNADASAVKILGLRAQLAF
ncbi:carbohydrate porin [Rhodocyclus tenuis]|uniref:Carbohydrate porin n=2 Tax=Rhodocyclus TaxID=1064 RepID=A0A6L5JTT3_RHOTE|nr:carbohydrate porin [Rhodocyclus gracilis]MQY50803.1 carbohydrate porin [Rhodocyclus gracilis]NJA87631.1 carbohydrate porin [Rhodocyclus gracilis]